eukprot:TRINITY_DN1698_c0_g2_i5.p1 TRINITY_DN1698_c0_g2~~TRINITY_DN1698_c0_g2_i5.p1  ORF type:complete len:221 (-),score=23.60 TRINITY_DN1698_c0_g2_i5:623-1285(-)
MKFVDTSKLRKSDFEIKEKAKKKAENFKRKQRKAKGIVQITVQKAEQEWSAEQLPPAVGIICGPNPISIDPSATFQGLSPDITEKGPEKARVIVRTELGQTEFLGDSHLETANEQLVKYSLGIYNKEDKTLTFVPILSGRPIPIRPRLKNKTYSDMDVSSVLRHDQEGIMIDRKDKGGITYEQRQEIWLKANNTFSKKLNPDKKKPMAIKVEKKTARGRR